MADADLLKEVKDCVDASESTDETWRKEGRETLLMKAGDRNAHWPGDSASARENEGLPALVVNQLPQFSQKVTGAFRLNQIAISLTAAEANDQRTVETMEGLIRAIQYDSVSKVAYRFALQNAADTGRGWLRISREYEAWDAWDQVLTIPPVPNPFCVYPDASSRRFDLEDCPRLVVLEEMPQDTFKKKWKGASTVDVDAGTGNRKRKWANEQDKTITIGEFWRKVPVEKTFCLIGDPNDPGTWETTEISKGTKNRLFQDAGMTFETPYGPSDFFLIGEAGPVPVIRQRTADAHQLEVGIVSGGDVLEKMRPEPGRYLPFVMVLGEEVHVDGERRVWGLLQNAKDPQRVWNYQWSAAVESVMFQSKVPYKMTAAMVKGYEDQWQAVNRQRLPYVLFNPDMQMQGYVPQREAPPVTPVAALALVEKAEQMLNSATGVPAETLGQETNAASGKAVIARASQGNVVTAVYSDNLVLAMEHLTKILLERIPIVYDRPRQIRILGADFAKRMPVGINGPGQPNLTQGRYDVMARIGPAHQTQEEAQFTALTEFGQSLGPQGAIGLADQVAAVAPVPNREKLVERVKVIQAQLGFSEDGSAPPQMVEQIMNGVMEAVQEMIPTPEKVQKVVLATMEQLANGQKPTPTPPEGETPPQGGA